MLALPLTLIGFDVAIDTTNEYSASSVPERATHDAEGDAEYYHVREIKECLEEARHFCLHEEVVD